jgi:hypothetical protein
LHVERSVAVLRHRFSDFDSPVVKYQDDKAALRGCFERDSGGVACFWFPAIVLLGLVVEAGVLERLFDVDAARWTWLR